MSDIFVTFRAAVDKRVAHLLSHPNSLFRMNVSKDDIWQGYLNAFPEGTNPIYKERREYECNCCKSWIRQIGTMVAIINGKIETVWDVPQAEGLGYFNVVATKMATLVRAANISNVYLHTELTAGTNVSRQVTESGVINWNHFYTKLPREVVLHKDHIGTELGKQDSSRGVFFRALSELKLEDIDTVLELIAQNSLYRGEEHKFVLQAFRKELVAFSKLGDEQKVLFSWERLRNTPPAVLFIRNSVIGSLLVDLQEGKDLEYAVKSFESKVAPTNYKRPTALITKSMIANAQKTVEELGYTSALERRYANISDITVNNILFGDRDAKSKMAGNVFDVLAAKVPEKTAKLDKVEEITIEKFLSEVVPTATSIEVMFENRHASNLVSLVAPVHADAKNMFKWPNKFSWSYAGDVADSIKERVKQAGGVIEGDLCCRLAWEYSDDLDFHMREPNNGHIHFGNRRRLSPCGGMLDIDANGADGIKEHPVENIFYKDKSLMKEGIYALLVNNYSRRSNGVGFEVEIEFGGQTLSFVYDKAIKTGEYVTVAEIKYSRRDGFSIVSSMPSTQTVKTVWGLPTQTFHKVGVIMNSPNHWDDKSVGNKHYFFMIEGCVNEGSARGFFNEYLSEDLTAHRKVLEMVGSAMKTAESPNQLSGIGFSSTQRNSVMCRVTGNFARVVKVVF